MHFPFEAIYSIYFVSSYSLLVFSGSPMLLTVLKTVFWYTVRSMRLIYQNAKQAVLRSPDSSLIRSRVSFVSALNVKTTPYGSVSISTKNSSSTMKYWSVSSSMLKSISFFRFAQIWCPQIETSSSEQSVKVWSRCSSSGMIEGRVASSSVMVRGQHLSRTRPKRNFTRQVFTSSSLIITLSWLNDRLWAAMKLMSWFSILLGDPLLWFQTKAQSREKQIILARGLWLSGIRIRGCSGPKVMLSRPTWRCESARTNATGTSIRSNSSHSAQSSCRRSVSSFSIRFNSAYNAFSGFQTLSAHRWSK